MYYVGPDYTPAVSITEALELAVNMIPEKRLGDWINIYSGKRSYSVAVGRVKVLYEKDTSKLRYVYFGRRCKYGHTITVDYRIDQQTRWFNGAF